MITEKLFSSFNIWSSHDVSDALFKSKLNIATKDDYLKGEEGYYCSNENVVNAFQMKKI